ncbi:MAG: TetR/AcrR family transcriptional regulator [Pseudomonadota bacterium]
MPQSRKRQDAVRKPSQARSQKRVEQILNAAKDLILSKGSAGLKMNDVADSAGVTIGSIYQYFPNKSAIVGALCKTYLDDNLLKMEAVLASPPADLDELQERISQLLKDFYSKYREDPVIRDIFAAMASDKTIQGIDADDTRQNTEIVFQRSRHLFDETRATEVKQALYLIFSFAGTAVNIAFNQNKKEGRRTIDAADTMLRAGWEAGIKPLARA